MQNVFIASKNIFVILNFSKWIINLCKSKGFTWKSKTFICVYKTFVWVRKMLLAKCNKTFFDCNVKSFALRLLFCWVVLFALWDYIYLFSLYLLYSLCITIPNAIILCKMSTLVIYVCEKWILSYSNILFHISFILLCILSVLCFCLL